MWISIPQLEITGKQFKELPKNAKNNNQLNTKIMLITEIAKWGSGFYI